MRKTIYIFSDGEIKRKENTLCFEREKEKKYIPIENVSEILIFGEVTINKRLLEFLTQRRIILHFFNYFGYYLGSYYPREHFNSGYMVLKQAEHYLDSKKRIALAKKFVFGAIENIKKVLVYYENRGKKLSEIIERIKRIEEGIDICKDTDELMAIEGKIREKYYHGFDEIIGNKDFAFEGRTRRPPQNRLNALISFANSIIYTICLSEIYHTHLDPRIGFLHATNFRRFTLNLDIAEVFKPIIADRVIFNVINKGIIKPENFERKLDGIVLNEKGREIIRLELFKVEKHLIGEEEYMPFITGW